MNRVELKEQKCTELFGGFVAEGNPDKEFLDILRVFMATLRKKLESAPDAPQFIQTHIGIGYRMLRIEQNF